MLNMWEKWCFFLFLLFLKLDRKKSRKEKKTHRGSRLVRINHDKISLDNEWKHSLLASSFTYIIKKYKVDTMIL